MSWETLLGFANGLALVMWAVLILAPRGELARSAIFYAGIGLLCLAYAVGFAVLLSQSGADLAGTDFTSIEGLRVIFSSDAALVIGWVHYLAFDLFVGLWVARDADAKQFSRLLQAPVLLLTLLAGPVGLLAWLIIREPAARRANPRKGKLKL
jgi:hypothetical protein